MIRKTPITVLPILSILWLIWVTWIAGRFSIPSSDGILYSLPLASAAHPFDLGVPYLEDFSSYGSYWGHNWPGSMWLRAIIFMVIPYSRSMDVGVLSLFQLLAAWCAGALVFQTTRRLVPSIATGALLLSDRILLLACSGNRFESIGVASALLVFASATSDPDQESRFRRALNRFAALLCPTMHPYALVIGVAILSLDLYHRRHRECIIRCGFFMTGCLALAGWFVLQPEAWHQFAINLKLQKSFYHDWNSVFHGLGNYRLHGGLILWIGALITALFLIVRWPRSWDDPGFQWKVLAPSSFLIVFIIHTVTRCENFHYLAFGTPFAIMMTAIMASGLSNHLKEGYRWLPTAAILALCGLHAVIHPFRLLQYRQAGMPNLDASYKKILEKLPTGRKVFIPHAMWPAALTDSSHSIHWFTFPIASSKELRGKYERELYATARAGDILIVDASSAGQADRFGLFPTFPTNPPDPSRWKLLNETRETFSGSTPWGIHMCVYEHTD